MICKIDNTEHESIQSMHKYLRSKNISQKEYYEKYEPKYDILTEEKIDYIDYDSYMFFPWKTILNMHKWFNIKAVSESGMEEAEKIALFLIEHRKIKKNMKYAPCMLEYILSHLPPYKFMMKNGLASYNSYMKDLKLQPRFDMEYPKKQYMGAKNFIITVDTREKSPLTFGVKTITQKLDVGDYALDSESSDIVIERKSLIDLCGTLSKGFERFNKELVRAQVNKKYLVILVESGWRNLVSIQENKEGRYISASPHFLFSRIRQLLQTYKNCQFLFVENKSEAAEYVIEIFKMRDQAKQIDLQSWYERRKI